MTAEAYRQHDEVMATFSPARRDDLRPETERWVGHRGKWYAGWVIEEGQFAGQLAWFLTLVDGELPPFRWWVPTEDLADIE